MNTIHYDKYVARVEYDEESDTFHGRVLGMRDVIEFYGRTVDELHEEFKTSVEEYLDMCEADNVAPEKPFSGKFTIRIDQDAHRSIALAASLRNQSLNSWATSVLSQAAQECTH